MGGNRMKAGLRLVEVQYDAGMSLETVQGWGAIASDAVGAPFVVFVVDDPDMDVTSQDMTQIPWSRVVKITDRGMSA